MDIGYTHHVRIRAILRVRTTIVQYQTDNTVINGDQQIPLLKRIMDFVDFLWVLNDRLKAVWEKSALLTDIPRTLNGTDRPLPLP